MVFEKYWYLFLWGLFFYSICGFSQEKDSLATQQLEAVTVSSGYSKTSKVLVPTVTINSTDIENNSTKDLVTTLNQTAGVFVQSGALNTNRITIRGVGSRTLYGTNKIRAYFNGIPITNGVGETSIDVYDPNGLAAIEIVKGPKATQYGTNLGGTLLLNSKEAAQGVHLSSGFTVGSFGMFKNTSSVNYGTKNLSLHVNYGHLDTDGFRENSRFNRNTYVLTTGYRFNEKNAINILINQIDYRAQIASSVGKTDFEEYPEHAAYTWAAAKGYEDEVSTLAGISYTAKISNTFSNTTSVYYTTATHYEPRPFNILNEHTQGFGVRSLFAKNLAVPNGNAVLSWGAEWFKDEYLWKTLQNLYEENNGNGSLAGALLSNNEEYRHNLNVFATYTLPVTNKLKAEMGLNLSKTSYQFQDELNSGDANTSANRSFNAIVAPNLSVTYMLNYNYKLFGNVSRGFNYPSVEETLTPEGIINPKIGPEKGWNYEVGTQMNVFKNRLYVNANAYILSITDLLVADRVGDDQYIGRNAGKTLHRGLEISADYHGNINSQWQLLPFINGELNFHKFKDFKDGEADFSGNDLTGVPNTKLSGGFTLQHTSGFYVYTNYLHIGMMPMNDANTLYSSAYNLLNLRMGYKKEIGTHFMFQAYAGINNATNTAYASAILINATAFGNAEPRYYYPGEPVNYYGFMSLRYNITP